MNKFSPLPFGIAIGVLVGILAAAIVLNAGFGWSQVLLAYSVFGIVGLVGTCTISVYCFSTKQSP